MRNFLGLFSLLLFVAGVSGGMIHVFRQTDGVYYTLAEYEIPTTQEVTNHFRIEYPNRKAEVEARAHKYFILGLLYAGAVTGLGAVGLFVSAHLHVSVNWVRPTGPASATADEARVG